MLAQLRGRCLGAIFVDPPLEPLCQLLETLLELNLRLVPENPLRLGDVAKAVADVAGAIVPGDIGFEMLLTQHLSQSLGNLEDRIRLPATEVEDLVGSRRTIQREGTPGSEVAH